MPSELEDERLLRGLSPGRRAEIELETDGVLDDVFPGEPRDAAIYERAAAELDVSADAYDGGPEEARLVAAGMRARARRLRSSPRS